MQREAAKKRLEHTNMLLSATLANMPQGICMFGADGKLVLANDLYSTMYGLDPVCRKTGDDAYGDFAASGRCRLLSGGFGKIRQRSDCTRRRCPSPAISSINSRMAGRWLSPATACLMGAGLPSIRTSQLICAPSSSSIRNQAISGFNHRKHSDRRRREGRRHAQIRTRQSHFRSDAQGRAPRGSRENGIRDLPTARCRANGRVRQRGAGGRAIGICSNDYEIEMPDGQARVIATSRIVTRDAAGAARHLVVVIDDITEKKEIRTAHRLYGPSRRTDRPCQPSVDHGQDRGSDRAASSARRFIRGLAAGPRPLQTCQRYAWPCRWRCIAARNRRSSEGVVAGNRRVGAPGR